MAADLLGIQNLPNLLAALLVHRKDYGTAVDLPLPWEDDPNQMLGRNGWSDWPASKPLPIPTDPSSQSPDQMAAAKMSHPYQSAVKYYQSPGVQLGRQQALDTLGKTAGGALKTGIGVAPYEFGAVAGLPAAFASMGYTPWPTIAGAALGGGMSYLHDLASRQSGARWMQNP